MEAKIKTLHAELEVFQATRASLIKEAEAIKAQLRAKEKQIKAQEELIASLTNANTQQTEGE